MPEHLQDQTQEQEDQASLAENILKDLKLQLDLRKQSNDANREALQGDLDAENARHELAKEHLGDEIAALKDQVAAGGASTPAMDAAFESIASKLTAVSATASQLANVSPPVA